MNQLDMACESFRILLQEQLQRIASMSAEKTDFSAKETVTVGLIDGDGIGPVLMKQAKRVLQTLLSEEIRCGTVILKQIHGLTIENRLTLGKSVPEDVL